MMLADAPRIARLVPLLGSPNDGEALGAARAIGRVLSASGQDWHRLAAELLQATPTTIPAHAQRPRRERTPRSASLDPEALRLLRTAQRLDVLTPWETTFAASILEASQRPGWGPSRRQRDVLRRLCERVQEAERHT